MNKASKTVLFAMAAGLAACSENSMAPRVEAPESSPAVYGGGASQSLSAVDTVRFSITIDPSRKTYYDLGEGNMLTFPVGSLCDVNKSSYGEDEWDKPCTKANSILTVNVKAWTDRSGHARVDFDKHVRFAPSSNPAQWVQITFADLEAAQDPMFGILYCPGTNTGNGSYGNGYGHGWHGSSSDNSNCYDESKKDPTLLVKRDPVTHKITRRIKHFSGYNVAAGREDSDSYYGANTAAVRAFGVAALPVIMRPTAAELLLSGVRFVRRGSGYILASG